MTDVFESVFIEIKLPKKRTLLLELITDLSTQIAKNF